MLSRLFSLFKIQYNNFEMLRSTFSPLYSIFYWIKEFDFLKNTQGGTLEAVHLPKLFQIATEFLKFESMIEACLFEIYI